MLVTPGLSGEAARYQTDVPESQVQTTFFRSQPVAISKSAGPIYSKREAMYVSSVYTLLLELLELQSLPRGTWTFF